MAIDADGNFIVTWTSYAQDESWAGIYAQRYRADGEKLGGIAEIQVNDYTTYSQINQAVAADGDGHYVIAWNNTYTNHGIFARQMTISGTSTYLRDGEGLFQEFTYGSATTATSSTAGDVFGVLQSVSVRRGEGSLAETVMARKYVTRAADSVTYTPVAEQSLYRSSSEVETTKLAYTFYSGTAVPETVTLTLPTITTAQNGSNAADSITLSGDATGRLRWVKDAAGALHHWKYDGPTGLVATRITDVDTTKTSTFTGLPSGWTTPGGGGLHLTNHWQYDGLGRTTAHTDAADVTTYVVYDDVDHEIRVYPAWDASLHGGNGGPTGPTVVYRGDWSKKYAEALTMTATPSVSGGKPTGTESVSGVQTLSRDHVNNAGQAVSSDVYFSLSGLTYSTSSTLGTEGTHFDRTEVEYGDRGWLKRVETATGTITRSLYDTAGRVTQEWTGTDDTPTSGIWSPTNTAGTDLVQLTAYEYDGGGINVGNGDLTKFTQYINATDTRVTQLWYDWRNRPVIVKGGVEGSESTSVNRPLTYTAYDNLGRVTGNELYDGDNVTVTSTSGVPNRPSSSLLRAKSRTYYDNQGRVYRTQTASVNQTTGAEAANVLSSDVWYDGRGFVIKSSAPGGLVQKYAYDFAGRMTTSYTTDGGGDTSYGDADDVTGDIVLEQMGLTYDANDNVTQVTMKQRFHDETGTGVLGTASSGVKARVSYVGTYFDKANRPTASVDVGTNGASSWTRPGTVPSRSDTALVTEFGYNAAGWVETVTDPRAIVGKTYYDAKGRVTKTIEAYVNGTVSAQDDKTTEFTYTGTDQLKTYKAWVTSTDYQETEYVYGVTTGQGSSLNSNDLMRAVKHPDKSTGAASASEQELLTYNRAGDVVTSTDRNDNVHTFSYDVVGRLTTDAVTTLGSGVDGSIRRLETAYDTAGRAYLFTSYSASSGGSVVNQVRRDFNGLGQLTAEHQAINGSVTVGTTPSVGYTYTEMSGGANHSRLTKMTYPDGFELRSNYGSGGGVNDRISRLAWLEDGTSTIEEYSYLGLGTVVRRNRPAIDIELTYIKQHGESNGSAGDQYAGLDSFGRIVDQRWRDTSDGSHTDRWQYGYDRNGNRLYKDNLLNNKFDELYHANGASNGYDLLNQLTDFRRGDLSDSNSDGVPDTVTTADRNQGWAFDGLGNFPSVTTDTTTVNRTHNRQNQVTTVGAATLTFDDNGNMTTDETGRTLTYDAWNRLVTVTEGKSTQTYEYDALYRRVEEGSNQLYYTAGWQVIEERVAGVAEARYVWSPVYVDAIILRDRDVTGDSALEERLWVQHDANWNVTALVNASGSVVERYAYDPYGKFVVLSATWTSQGSSGYAWVYLHQGGRYDAASGLFYFRMRDFSPNLMRWGIPDPLRHLAYDINYHRFVSNNPISFSDPSGLAPPDGIPLSKNKWPRWAHKLPGTDSGRDGVDRESIIDKVLDVVPDLNHPGIGHYDVWYLEEEICGEQAKRKQRYHPDGTPFTEEENKSLEEGGEVDFFDVQPSKPDVLATPARSVWDVIWDDYVPSWETVVGAGKAVIIAGGATVVVVGGAAAAPELALSGAAAALIGVFIGSDDGTA